MTTAPPPDPPTERQSGFPSWPVGPPVDLLLAAGGICLISVPILLWYTSQYGFTQWSLGLVAIFPIAINAPRFPRRWREEIPRFSSGRRAHCSG